MGIIGHIEVCTDCYFYHHYGNEGVDIDADGTIAETGLKALGRVEGMELTDDTDSETGDGITTFSRDTCDGCGSHLGGSRHRLAEWSPR